MTVRRTVPLLRADGASMDWTHATYRAAVKVGGYSAGVQNTLVGAPELEEQIRAGSAQWALELRCPRTLFARTDYSAAPNFSMHWSADEVGDELYITPGLVAVRALYLRPDGLNRLWGDDPIEVPKGRWLARGAVLHTKSLAASLLTFVPNQSLTDGQIAVEPVTTSGDLRFNASLPPALYGEVRHRRDIQIGALIAAMGRIPHLDSADDDAYPILHHIRDALTERGVRIWGEELNSEFDPAAAATAIEGFQITPPGDQD